MPDIDFTLHPRLEADTVGLGRTSLCEIRLMNDAQWPWVLLIPRVEGIREIYELASEQQQQLLNESSFLSRGMMAAFKGAKMNVAALGNMVPQLHLHHIVRFESDPAWPGPVWGKVPPIPYSEGQLTEVKLALNDTLKGLVVAGL